MHTTITYHCDICGWHYSDKDSALCCEAKGRPPEYPRGMIFGNPNQGFYKNITFAIAEPGVSGHQNTSAQWAMRDNGAGDSSNAKDLCGGNSLRLNHTDVPNRKHPTFIRMVKFLKRIGFSSRDITVWNGSTPVSLAVFLGSHR